MISQHTAGAPGASGLVPQHHCGNDQGGEASHAGMYCDECLDHADHDYHGVSYAQQHAASRRLTDQQMVGPPAEHSACPDSDFGCFTRPHSVAEHPALPHSTAEQAAQLQVSDLHNHSREDFQNRQASRPCQQPQDARARRPMHHNVCEPQAASTAYPHHAEHYQVPQLVPEQQQPSQPHAATCAADLRLPQQQQEPAGPIQHHDHGAEQMHAPVGSPASGSHLSVSQQSGKPPNSDAAQAGKQGPGSPATTAAAARASVAQAVQSPQRLHALPELDPALLAHRLRHAHSQGPNTGSQGPNTGSQGPNTAAGTHQSSTKDKLISDPAVAVVNEQPAAATAAAQSTLSHDCAQSPYCPQSPQQQMQPETSPPSAHDGSQQDRVRSSPNASSLACLGNTDKTDACWHAEEDFEQDQLSQPSSSESDEDFQPSEYEQDELSQPSSSSGDELDEDEDDDAFEVDEMSQPESSSEDDEHSPLRAESSLKKVCSTARALPANMAIKSRQEDVVRQYVNESSRPQLSVTAASGRSGVKRSRQDPLSADHKARLGFPKPAQPAKAVPVQKGYLIGSSLPLNSQTMPTDQSQRGLKRTVPNAAEQQGGQKRRRTTASASDAHEARLSAEVAERPDEEQGWRAPAAQQVSQCDDCREWQTCGYTIELAAQMVWAPAEAGQSL